jgi:hypothetical protein
MIMRRPLVELLEVEATDEKEDVEPVLNDVIEEKVETSERLDVVRDNGVSGGNDSDAAESGDVGAGEKGAEDENDVRGKGAREEGGTSWTWRLRG